MMHPLIVYTLDSDQNIMVFVSDASQSKSTGWMSRLKNMVHSIADHVSQVCSSPCLSPACSAQIICLVKVCEKCDKLKMSIAYLRKRYIFLHTQVPLSLAIKITSVRGVLRVHFKPPPSDQLWFGFTSMPELEWDLESSVGDRKITHNRISSLIGNRIKVKSMTFL